MWGQVLGYLLDKTALSIWRCSAHSNQNTTTRGHFFYEKVIRVKADVAALLMFDLGHISTKKFALDRLGATIGKLDDP
jgi:hypothetical protein